jgi:hypothetical protein
MLQNLTLCGCFQTPNKSSKQGAVLLSAISRVWHGRVSVNLRAVPLERTRFGEPHPECMWFSLMFHSCLVFWNESCTTEADINCNHICLSTRNSRSKTRRNSATRIWVTDSGFVPVRASEIVHQTWANLQDVSASHRCHHQGVLSVANTAPS